MSWGKHLSSILKNCLPTLVSTVLLNGGLNQVIVLFLFFQKVRIIENLLFLSNQAENLSKHSPEYSNIVKKTRNFTQPCMSNRALLAAMSVFRSLAWPALYKLLFPRADRTWHFHGRLDLAPKPVLQELRSNLCNYTCHQHGPQVVLNARADD